MRNEEREREGRIHVMADIDNPHDLELWRRVYSPSGIAPTLTCGGTSKVIKVMDSEGDGCLKVRILTPRECWQLMGQPDWAYDAVAKVSSRTQLYNQAGNSIVVEVLRAIFRTVADVPPRSESKKRLVQKSLDEWFCVEAC